LYNQTQDQVVVERNAYQIRPFASITKLMTAMIVIDQDWNWERRLRLSKLAGSKLPPGTYTRRELLRALLINSDNAAAETFAADYPGGRSAFLQAMNQRAWQLSMYSTQFQDPSGLSSGNVSNAGDLGTLIRSAGEYSIIRDISIQPHVAVETHSRKRSRMMELSNTNGRALGIIENIQVSKTGFTNPAGFCMALQVEQHGEVYLVVVLGAKNSAKRLDLVKNLLYNHTAEVVDTPRKSKKY
jgi:D-alanyl-D-alanine endopeptidase (penicillin-binding protein 7)